MYLNAFSLLGVGLFTAFCLMPSFTRSRDQDGIVDTYIFEDVGREPESSSPARILLLLSPTALLGFTVTSLVHSAILVYLGREHIISYYYAIFYIVVALIVCILMLRRNRQLNISLGKLLEAGHISRKEYGFLKRFRRDMQLNSFFLMLPIYVLSSLIVSKSRSSELISFIFFLVSPLLFTIMYLALVGIKQHTIKEIAILAAMFTLGFFFIWPGLGRIAGATLNIFNEGGSISVTIYIREESKSRYSSDEFRAVQPGDLFPNPLKRHFLLLNGSSRIYITQESINDCEKSRESVAARGEQCPRVLSLPKDDVQSVRYE